jgi:2-isopropylmalate synthase
MKVELYDTTLRDGTQMEGISLSVQDKLKIARKLDELGVHYVEGGWPGSNPKDAEFFAAARSLDLKNAKVVAFGSTRRASTAEKDATCVPCSTQARAPSRSSARRARCTCVTSWKRRSKRTWR